MKKTACLTLCICLFVFTASFASAQLLDDLWFQVKFKANGFVTDDGTNTYYHSSHSSLAYLHLAWIDSVFYTATCILLLQQRMAPRRESGDVEFKRIK